MKKGRVTKWSQLPNQKYIVYALICVISFFLQIRTHFMFPGYEGPEVWNEPRFQI